MMEAKDAMLKPEDLTQAELDRMAAAFTDMTEFEADLHQSLRAVDAPAGFAERVLAKAQAAPATRPTARVLSFSDRFRAFRSLPAMGAIAAGLLIAAFTGYDVHQRHEEHLQQAAEATQQFDLATEITDRAVERAQEHARQQIERAGIPANVLQ